MVDLEVRFAGAPRVDRVTELLAIPVVERDGAPELADLPAELADALSERYEDDDVRSRTGASVTVYTGWPGGAKRVLLLGVGAEAELTAESVRRFAGSAVRKAEEIRVSSLTLLPPRPAGLGIARVAQAATEGAVLAAWRFGELKTEVGRSDDEEPPVEVNFTEIVLDGEADEIEKGIETGRAVGRGQNFARSLQARPGNVATPSHLAEEASRMAAAVGLTATVFGPDRMREEHMHALLAVAQGSDQEPRLIVVEHRGGAEGDAPLVLVGKGLTFDAGGISLKPPKGMEDMKFDMSGGAAVLGAIQAVAELELPLNVVAIVPSSENLIDGGALKPGDVIRTRASKTVEVINTDAEGRLILADALDYALTFEPAAVVDLATLTGAVVIGLGHHAAAVLGTDDDLIEELRTAGDTAGERCWPLPLWREYRKQLESETADFMNVGGRPAGTITAAAFLKEFAGDVPWAHLDIAGTAYGTEPLSYQRKGGYGFPTRLLVEWVRSRVE